MESPRLPRFTRARAISPITLKDRDRQIIRLVHRHRFLRSSHICSLIQGSRQQVLRRLQLLFHHGYLERPRSQIEYYHRGGSREIVYGLGRHAAEIVKVASDTDLPEFDWSKKNRGVERVFLEHALLVSDVMVALEITCRSAGIRLLVEDDLSPGGTRGRPRFRWRVKIGGGMKLSVVPDRAFGLEFRDASGLNRRAYFFLEADRGTMPVTRRNLLQTSFRRKLLAYKATWLQSVHLKRFGFHRFRVLTVTTSQKRVQSLVNACAELSSGKGLFLFADKTILENPANLFSNSWRRGKDGAAAGILD